MTTAPAPGVEGAEPGVGAVVVGRAVVGGGVLGALVARLCVDYSGGRRVPRAGPRAIATELLRFDSPVQAVSR